MVLALYLDRFEDDKQSTTSTGVWKGNALERIWNYLQKKGNKKSSHIVIPTTWYFVDDISFASNDKL